MGSRIVLESQGMSWRSRRWAPKSLPSRSLPSKVVATALPSTWFRPGQ